MLHSYWDQFGQPCVTGKTNCSNDSYEWGEFNITTGFFIDITGPDNNPYTVTIADVERWFDYGDDGGYLTRGWSKIAPMDFTRNCHGYTFDKNHWVQATQYGVLKLVTGSQGPCYPSTQSKLEANYVIFGGASYSARVSGALCGVVQMGPGMWYYAPTIVQRIEKNGCGPVYKKVVYCPAVDQISCSQGLLLDHRIYTRILNGDRPKSLLLMLPSSR